MAADVTCTYSYQYRYPKSIDNIADGLTRAVDLVILSGLIVPELEYHNEETRYCHICE